MKIKKKIKEKKKNKTFVKDFKVHHWRYSAG